MALKSSWELALERTGGKSTAKLTDKQKKALAELEQMSHDLLANPLIESYEIELLEGT